MPIAPRAYVPLPFAGRPRQTPDTRTLGAILLRQGQEEVEAARVKGAMAAQLWQQIGQQFSNFAQGRRAEQQQATVLSQRKAEQDADAQLKRDEMEARRQEREEAARIRREGEEAKRKADAYKHGAEVADDVKYGPMSETQMEGVLEGPAAGRARYVFGPGTADGPELLPNKDQQALIDWKAQVEGKGGMVSPTGAAVMPPAPTREPNPTEASLAMMAAKGDRGAIRALEILTKHKEAGRAPEAPKAPPKLPAGMATTVAAAKTSLAGLDTLEKMFKDSFVGPVAGRYNQKERNAPSVPGLNLLPDAPEGFEDFSAETAALKNRVIQAITGAAVGVQEQGRIMGEIPDLTDQPSVWRAKAKATRRNLEELKFNQIQMGTGAQDDPIAPGTTVEINIPSTLANPFRKK